MQKKYYNSFIKVVGNSQASKLMQLEDCLKNIVLLAIQESIPFIDELHKSKLKEAVN